MLPLLVRPGPGTPAAGTVFLWAGLGPVLGFGPAPGSWVISWRRSQTSLSPRSPCAFWRGGGHLSPCLLTLALPLSAGGAGVPVLPVVSAARAGLSACTRVHVCAHTWELGLGAAWHPRCPEFVAKLELSQAKQPLDPSNALPPTRAGRRREGNDASHPTCGLGLWRCDVGARTWLSRPPAAPQARSRLHLDPGCSDGGIWGSGMGASGALALRRGRNVDSRSSEEHGSCPSSSVPPPRPECPVVGGNPV